MSKKPKQKVTLEVDQLSVDRASDVSGCWESNVNSSFKMQGFEQKFVWTIQNINKCLESPEREDIDSPVFHLGVNGDCRLYLTLSKSKVNDIGFYVNLESISEEKIVAHFCVFIFGIFETKKCFLDAVSIFNKERKEWGRSICIKKETLLDKSYGYVEGDKLDVHCIIQFLNDVNNVHIETSEKHRRFLEDFEYLAFEEALSDLTLVVSGENFPVHRNILVQRCKYFETLLMENWHAGVKDENNLEIENVTPDVFREVLRFIYCGKVNDLREMARELLAASETYYMRDLKILCEGELLKNLCTDNAVDYLIIADRHKLNSLKMHALDLISENSNEIMKTQGFETLCDSGNSRLLGEAFAKMSEMVDTKLMRAGQKRKYI